MKYSGFWKRVAASIIDYMIVTLATFPIFFILGLAMMDDYGDIGLEYDVFTNIAAIVLGWVYYATMESSPKQGTLGKIALSIKVVDLNENRISFAQASGRHFGKIISSIILCIGFIMAGFTEKKQTLHDIMAGTLVVDK